MAGGDDGCKTHGRAFQEAYQVKREIHLDSLDGQAPHAYGLLPSIGQAFDVISRGLLPVQRLNAREKAAGSEKPTK